MNSINNIQDEKVRRLAETLRQSGLAASETEAIRMATSMTNTSDKVSQSFDDRKDKNIMGLSHLNKGETLAEAIDEEPVKEPQNEHSEQNNAEEQEVKEESTTSEAEQENTPETEETIDQGIAEEPQEEEHVEEKKPEVSTQERAPPKKDISEMAESKISLSDVFNSSK